MTLSIVGYGSRLVPRAPFRVTIRPPKLLVEHGGHGVFFGEHEGGLGAAPAGGATVDDVIEDSSEYPRMPLYALFTEDYRFPVVDAVKIFSTADADWPFELTPDDAEDPAEMIHLRGPLDGPVDLDEAMRGSTVTATGSVEKNNGTCDWSEHAYEHDGVRWRQRLYALSLFSAQ